MEIRIGIQNSARELSFETASTATEIEQAVSDALSGAAPFIKLTDDAGKVYIVPTATFAFIEVGSEKTRRVGFVA
ncbi:DUF3107 domain-containing protein [Naasia lichenicola]|uniref:DUF3107 domain-containing protein n=1 Tax=Naasia lichenicola TaxID=2565933 RepID=A0A4S4FFR8_9MICO|nr:DUF3107 domain-containing protein [Naasia lichenicola]THG28494.1 DUF3107 domain-containing protein [Naasia lichenicola]